MIESEIRPAQERSHSNWLKRLKPYRSSSIGRASFEVAVTLIPFLGLWIATALLVSAGHWWCILLTIPNAAFLLRLFMIQHDCGHGSFFGRRSLDDWTGRLLGVLTFTPYDCWRGMHATHHASSGNLDARGTGDVLTLTVKEYEALNIWGRIGYRLYRNPVVMFGLGPAFLFLIQQRLPVGAMRAGMLPWISAMGTNVAIGAVAVPLIWMMGLLPFLLVQLPIILIAATLGVWLFYVQHQFEETQWDRETHWEFESAALNGSSFLDLPQPIRWFTANIGVHHVHHMASRVPFYRLPEVLQDFPELKSVSRISIRDSFAAIPLVLWDETQRRLISFRQARQLAR